MQAGILEMRTEIGNARGAAEMWKREGKFRVKEKDKDKKGERKSLRKDLKKERGRKSGIEWKYAKEEEIFARRHKTWEEEGGRVSFRRCRIRWVLLERLEAWSTQNEGEVSCEIKESEAVRGTSSFKLE